MSENTTPVEGGDSAESGVNTTPETSQETHSDGLLGAKETTPEVKTESGLDPELYNTETNEFRKDVALKKIEGFKAKEESYEKQVKDLRRIVSKGKAPEDISEYDTYEPDSKYEKYWDFKDDANPIVKEVSTELNQMSKDLGFNLEQNKKVKDFLNSTMEKAGVFDARTPEQLEIAKADWKNEQLKVLGDDASTVISGVKDLLNSNMFSESEKNALLQSADKDANVIAALHKFKRLIRGQDQVPLRGAETSGVPSAMALAREYNDGNTPPERRRQILEQNRKVYGKPLPMIRG